MPVSNWTYFYLTLTIADFLCSLLATVKRNEAHMEIFIPTTPLMLLSFMSHLHAIQAV